MSRERRRRADRIVDARQRLVDVAQAELGALAQKTLEANRAAESARNEWRARSGSRTPTECTSHELALECAYVTTLDRRADYFAQVAREALAREERARCKVTLAKTEHKKVETWRDRLVEACRLEDVVIERLQSDDLAARISRRA